MTSRNTAAAVDIAFVAILTLFYLLVNAIRFAGVTENLQFIIMVNVLFALVVISYFAGVLTSLILCMIFVFGYGSYILYTSLFLQTNVSLMDCLWIVFIPVVCVLVCFFRTYVYDLQSNVEKYNIAAETTLGFDETTNLLNERMFHYELRRYMAMAGRGYIKVSLMMIRLNYYDDILRLIGRKGMDGLLRDIGERVGEMTRTEDVQFFVDERGVFSLILISDSNGASIVRDRIKDKIKNIEMQEKMKIYKLNLELKIGITEYSESVRDSIEFRQLAEKNMEFDV